MKPTHHFTRIGLSNAKQRGLSLIELLISMLIGLIILAAGTAVYVTSGRTAKVSEVSTRLNEDGVLAMNFLQTQIRQAGYAQKLNATDDARFDGAAVRGCHGGFVDPQAAADATRCVPNPAATANDAILVRYEADTSNTFPTAATPVQPAQPTNCNGDAITVPWVAAVAGTGNPPVGGRPARFQADNRFYVNTQDNMLYCAGNVGGNIDAPKPLFANVQEMVLRYGVARQTSLRQTSVFEPDLHQVERYLTASEIEALGGADINANWGRVLSVKICLLMRSDSPVKDAVGINQYTNCNGAVVNNPDNHLYRTFVSTVMLRNRLVTPEQTLP